MEDVHLPASKNQSLLWWWYTRLLLDFLLDTCDLVQGTSDVSDECEEDSTAYHAYLVIQVDIKLDL